MGQDTRVRITSLGQESGGLSSSLDSAFNQVCDLGPASNLPGLRITTCKIRGMGLEEWFPAFNVQQNCLWRFLKNIQPETSSEMFQMLLRWICCFGISRLTRSLSFLLGLTSYEINLFTYAFCLEPHLWLLVKFLCWWSVIISNGRIYDDALDAEVADGSGPGCLEWTHYES